MVYLKVVTCILTHVPLLPLIPAEGDPSARGPNAAAGEER